ncbi:MAG: hypothetical protein M1825_003009 [Sarcosagium campestre]|nr:MAG: hypothetical protein M1825_003009 [Sarcosagium campestre]
MASPPPIKRSLADPNGSRHSSRTTETVAANGVQPRLETAPARHSFNSLPPEVRSMIYHELYVQETPIRPLCHEDRYTEVTGTACPPCVGSGIALLRASRLIHAEASQVLYGKNTFLLYALDFGDQVLNFLRAIGKRNRMMIRNLQLDWQHGINKINQTSHASDLFSMVSDMNNPLRKDLAKMLHEIGRATIDKFVASLELMVGSPRLQNLTILCPGNESPSHPDSSCLEYRSCTGCHHEVPKVLLQIKDLKSLTIGDTDWRGELETLALEMRAAELSVTQLDCNELSDEENTELEKGGWTTSIPWRDPHSDEFRRMTTKKLIRRDDGSAGSKKQRHWCVCFRRLYVCESHAGDLTAREGAVCGDDDGAGVDNDDDDEWCSNTSGDYDYGGGDAKGSKFAACLPRSTRKSSRGRVEHWIATQMAEA